MKFKEQFRIVHTTLTTAVVGCLARLEHEADEDGDDVTGGIIVHVLLQTAIRGIERTHGGESTRKVLLGFLTRELDLYIKERDEPKKDLH